MSHRSARVIAGADGFVIMVRNGDAKLECPLTFGLALLLLDDLAKAILELARPHRDGP